MDYFKKKNDTLLWVIEENLNVRNMLLMLDSQYPYKFNTSNIIETIEALIECELNENSYNNIINDE